MGCERTDGTPMRVQPARTYRAKSGELVYEEEYEAMIAEDNKNIQLSAKEDALATYRTMNVVGNTKPEFGLIVAPKIVPHTCNYPGLWKRFFRWITFRPINEYSMFRCKCGKVFMLQGGYDLAWLRWKASYPGSWSKIGGIVKEK